MENRHPPNRAQTAKLYNASTEKHYPLRKCRTGLPLCKPKKFGPRLRRTADKEVTSGRFRAIFGAHVSEDGWDLPRDHARHILNFPIDILRVILSFILVAPCEITPLAVSYNKSRRGVTEIQEPSYVLTGFKDPNNHYSPYGICYMPSLDGSYAGWYRNPIDATILRVCKVLYQEGCPLLYGENDFVFDFNEAWLYYPFGDYKSVDSKKKTIRKERTMPPAELLESDAVQEAIRDIGSVEDPEGLQDWIFCDPFTRFLHSIGPSRASFIRKLRFVGTLFSSGDFSIGRTDEIEAYRGNLRYFLRVYSKLISQYCPNVEKFGIGVPVCCIEDMVPTNQQRFDEPWTCKRSFREQWYVADPQDRDIQDGDEAIASKYGKDELKAIRVLRERTHFEKKAKAFLDIENRATKQYLKPIIDEITPKLEKLQKLEVKRYKITEWKDFDGMKYRENYAGKWDSPDWDMSWDGSTDSYGREKQPWIDLDIADEAKEAIKLAVLKRSMLMEAAKEISALKLQDAQKDR